MVTPSSAALPETPVGWTLHRPPESTTQDHGGRLFAGRYLLSQKIGSGGMSTIYAARDVLLGKPVVVKILRADLPSDPVDRFRREALVLAKLSHEHIGGIIDRQDPPDGPRYLVAEYIDGLDLSVLRRRGPVPAAVVLQIGLHVSAALAYAHAEGVIHRDVKPSNVMLVRHPGGDVFAKIIDFGIAKLARGSDLADDAPAAAKRETRGDAVAGTAPYWNGLEGLRRDVYALALSLAELLTGEPPDPAADLAREHIPAGLAKVITVALRGEITTMDVLHAALREADVQLPAEAETVRRRYIAEVFPVGQASKPLVADDASRFAGRYIVGGELGAGGMGCVRVAFDSLNRRRVALKTIHPRHAGMTSLEHRLRREAWALAAIDHPGAPILYDSGTEPEPFFTMEIVDGMTLAAVLERGKLAPLRALGVAIELAAILHAAHEVGVIHRDVKPDNIVLGQGDRVRLLDFGACLLMPRFHQRHLLFPATPPELRYATGELERVGTPGYSAPETMRGGAGPRSDIYSVCVVLYEMLTGRRYESPRSGRALRIERGEFPAALGPVADVLRQGTAREPSERLWNMADLIRSLEILRAGAIHTPQRRQLVVIAVMAVVTTAVLAALAFHLLTKSTAAIEAVVLAAPPTSPDAADPPARSPSVALSALPEPSSVPTIKEATAPSAAAHPPASPPASSQAGVTNSATGARKRGAATRPPAVLTVSDVEARLANRHQRLAKCGTSVLALDLTIAGGRHQLGAVNGMSEGDPLHACVRDELRGLVFPATTEPQEFTVTINLGPKVK